MMPMSAYTHPVYVYVYNTPRISKSLRVGDHLLWELFREFLLQFSGFFELIVITGTVLVLLRSVQLQEITPLRDFQDVSAIIVYNCVIYTSNINYYVRRSLVWNIFQNYVTSNVFSDFEIKHFHYVGQFGINLQLRPQMCFFRFRNQTFPLRRPIRYKSPTTSKLVSNFVLGI